MLRQRKSLVLFLVLVFLAAGCLTTGQKTTTGSSAKELAWKTLTTGKQAYDATFTLLAQLDKQGKLSAEAKAKAIRLGNLYMAAHNQAVDDLLAGKDPALSGVNAALKGFMDYAAIVKGGK